MDEKMKVDPELIRILDVLTQIRRLNEMINLHKEDSNSLMRDQYQEMKKDFLLELRALKILLI